MPLVAISIFRASADNPDRLMQLKQAKEKYAFVVILLTVEKKILEHRYLKVGERNTEDFSSVWNNWINVEKPAWEKCADCIVETSRTGFVQ